MVEAGLTQFFLNLSSRTISDSRPLGASKPPAIQAAVTPPYTKIAKFPVLGILRATIIHDSTHPPEWNDALLEQAIKACYDKNRQAGQRQNLPEVPRPTDTRPRASLEDAEGDRLVARDRADLETSLTQHSRALYLRGDTVSSEVRELHNRQYTLSPHHVMGSSRGPMFVSIARTSGWVGQALVNVLHLENQLVRNHCIQWHRAEEAVDQNRPVFPQPGAYHSVVFNGEKAYAPIPVYHSTYNTAAQTQFVLFLEQANAVAQEIVLLVRGISGHSVFRHTYSRIHKVRVVIWTFNHRSQC